MQTEQEKCKNRTRVCLRKFSKFKIRNREFEKSRGRYKKKNFKKSGEEENGNKEFKNSPGNI